jgi:histone-lysine N-methyltransferase SETMAR
MIILQVLRCDLVHALEKKRPGVPLEHFILHMDNASSHTAAATDLEGAVLSFGRVAHPPYSPDLAPFDFAIFPVIKSQLKGQKFTSLHELSTAT